MHPELPVKTSDPNATGRNFFDRASAQGHREHIRSEGQQVDKKDAVAPVADYRKHDDHGYYNDHVDHHLHHEHQDQSDHFDMDEDMSPEFQEFRESLRCMSPTICAPTPMEAEEEGKLSRSPSSVMLFDEAAM
jgi:hypothetical protein